MTQPKASSPVLFRMEAGKNIGDIYLGDSLAKIAPQIQATGNRSDYQTEFEVFENFGYKPLEYLQFHIGFDHVQIFDEADNPSYPIFKLYFKNEALVFMIITSYGSDIFNLEACRRMFTERNIAFGASISEMVMAYGSNYAKHVYGTYDGDFIYPELGISFIADEGKVRVIRLFEPMNVAECEAIRAKYPQ